MLKVKCLVHRISLEIGSSTAIVVLLQQELGDSDLLHAALDFLIDSSHKRNSISVESKYMLRNHKLRQYHSKP